MATAMHTDHEAIYRPALEALAALDSDYAQRQNGLGFAASDSDFGHKMVEQEWPWTPRQLAVVHRILSRYAKTQLPDLGFDFASFPLPPTAPEKPQQPRPNPRATAQPVRTAIEAVARLEGSTVLFNWDRWDPNADERMADVKSIPGRRWNPDRKYWEVALTPSSVPALVRVLTAQTWQEAPQLRGRIAELQGAMETAIEASQAASADYAITGIAEPEKARPFQRAGVAFAVQHKRVIVADDMGLGKTLQSIATMTSVGAQRVLIVCPASLKLNWQREIAQWVGAWETITVIEGRKTFAIPASRWVIINSDILSAWSEVLGAIRWDGLIVDEAHQFKSGDRSQRGKALSAILREAKPEHVMLLTGTPILNRPIELWPLLKALGKEDAVGGWGHFTRHYCNATLTGFGWDFSGASNLDELNLTLRSGGIMIRRRKADVLKELPSRLWSTVPVQMSKSESREYRTIERGLEGETEVAIKTIGELRQYTARLKADQARLWIESFLETGQKLVVFTWHREVSDILAASFNAPKIVGGMSQRAVEAGKRSFQEDPETRVIVCNIAAGGVGHTLTAASNVLFVERAWNAALMDQALDRCHRIGQTADSVTGWVMTSELADGSETIDAYMEEMIVSKRNVTTAGVDGSKTARQALMSRLRARLLHAEEEEIDGDRDDRAA